MRKRWAVLPLVLGVTWLMVAASSVDSEAAAPTTGNVVINELMYHPANDREDQEYVELTNSGSITTNLSGWWFSDGLEYVFPSGTLLPPGGYLVIARDPSAVAAQHGLDSTQLLGPFETTWLSNAGERIALRDAAGDLVDKVTYRDHSPWATKPDGQGPSLELINPAFHNDQPCSWAASSGSGTPGAQNSVHATDIPPCVKGVSHTPLFPTSSQVPIVTARLQDNGSIITATVYHRPDDSPYFSATLMLDDGSGADATAGDGIYAGQLSLYADGSLVEFYVEATDDAGLTTRVPTGAPQAISSETGGPLTISYLFLVEDAPPTSTHSLYRLLVTDENWTELTSRHLYSNRLLDATFVYQGQTYYNVGLRYRGESSRPLNPKSYRVNFPSARPFQGIRRLNLVGDHISREALTYDLFRRAGLVASETAFVDLYINSAHQALYVTVEQVDEDFLEAHFPGNDGGNLYRAKDGGDLSYRGSDPDDYRPYYLKKSNESADDYTDVIALTDALTNSPEEHFRTVAESVADMEQWMRWFAINAIAFNTEGALFIGHGDDYFLYHRPSDDRFMLLPWDHDSTFYNASGSIWASTLPIVKRILNHPPFTRKYYQNIVALMADEFSVATMHPLIDALPAELEAEKEPLKQFMTDRVDYLVNYFETNVPDRSLVITTGGGESFTTTQRIDQLEGECSPWRDVYVEGSAESVTYSSIYEWQSLLPLLRPGANRFVVTDRDLSGEVVTTRTITITYDVFDGGTLTENLTLTLEASPHVILEDIFVPPSLTLTVEPGATVAFAEGTSLFVEGRLLAEGTPGQPILFTRDVDSGYWGAIGIYGSQQDNRMVHTVVEYAGSGSYEAHPFNGVSVYQGQLTLNDSELRNPRHAALELVDSNAYVRRNYIRDTVSGVGLRAEGGYVEIEDNLFRKLYGADEGILLRDRGSRLRGAFRHNTVYGVQGDCVHVEGFLASLERNTVHHCTGAGMSIYNTSPLTLANNLIYHNTVGVVVRGAAQTRLAHNTLAYNDTAGLAVKDPDGQAMLLSSIVWESGTSISYTTGASITVSYSDVQGGWSGPGQENLDADPQFFYPAAAIFRLRETSPCVDRAIAQGAPPLDLMGIPRPKGDGYDIGALEFFEYFSVYLPFAAQSP